MNHFYRIDPLKILKGKSALCRYFSFVLLLLMCFIPKLLALEVVIQETTQIRDIVPYVDNATLVIFDLDNTLIEPEQHIASDQWFDQRFKEFLKTEKLADDALSKLEIIYHLSKNLTKEILIEPDSVQIIQNLQKEGNLVFILTSRASELYAATLRHLLTVGIDIDLSHHGLDDISYKFLQGTSSHAYQGLILCGGQHKGRSLVEYINYLKTNPALHKKLAKIKKIVFVDDKAKYLEQIKESLPLLGIDGFYGFRYARLDNKVSKMPSLMEIARIQEEFLGKILTNEAANDIAQARNARIRAS